RQELTPSEDRALILLSVQAPQGVSPEYTESNMHQIEQLVAPLRASGEVANIFAITGMGGQDNRGLMVLSLAPWEQRSRSQQDISDQLQKSLQAVIGVRAYTFQTNSLGIRGA